MKKLYFLFSLTVVFCGKKSFKLFPIKKKTYAVKSLKKVLFSYLALENDRVGGTCGALVIIVDS